jgi:hypothetical protein
VKDANWRSQNCAERMAAARGRRDLRQVARCRITQMKWFFVIQAMRRQSIGRYRSAPRPAVADIRTSAQKAMPVRKTALTT